MKIDAVILAAGKGTRMYSNTPKVLHRIGNKPMVSHVLDAVRSLGDVAIRVVVGHGAEKITAVVGDDVQFVQQDQQLGTGHAVAQALPSLRGDSLCLILYGDVPLITIQTLEELIGIAGENRVAILTAILDDATGYGRIIRDAKRAIVEIVEQRDATPDQLAVNEINSGIMCIPQRLLAKWLPALSSENSQNEYYLTDVIKMAVDDGIQIVSTQPKQLYEIDGVNNKLQLAALERIYQRLRADELLTAGVTLADPQRIDIRGNVQCGRDVYIDVNAVLIGDVTIADNVRIGPNCVIDNSSIGANSQILANSVIENAVVGEQCNIGPYARLRPGSNVQNRAKLGNFVEVKNATIGDGSKVNHLAYIGDADIGTESNIGAGTIVCNYDGAYKHKTTIGDRVFVGSNSTLVAPLVIESDGFVAAGSTVTSAVGQGSLAVARARQRNIEGWKRPKKS